MRKPYSVPRMPPAGAGSTQKSRTIVFAPARIAWRPLLAFCGPFLLYLCTLAPTIYNLDSAEFTVAAATGGLTRATGYPLYLLLGRIWVHLLPFGDFGYRLNMFSAVCGALTILFAERILQRWKIGDTAALAALGLLTVSPYFWGLSLIAEVYTMQTALMSALLLLLLRWADNPEPRRLDAVAFLGGMSLGHHAATILLIPGFVVFAMLLAGRRLWRPGVLGRIIGLGLLGFAIYLYLPLVYLTHPAFNYAGSYDANGIFHPLNLLRPDDLFVLISARAFLANAVPSYAGPPLLTNLGTFFRLLLQAFFIVGIGPAILGAIVQFRRNRPQSILLLLLLLCNTLFFANYSVVDHDTMFLPIYLIWALWLAIGYQWLLDWLRQDGGVVVQRAFGLLLIGVVVLAAAWNWRLVDRSHDVSARARGEALARQILPNALVLGAWQTVPLLEHMQLVEGQRQDIMAINMFLISPDDMYALIAREAGKRPVYLDQVPTNLPEHFQLRPAGLLFRVELREASTSSPLSRCPLAVDRTVVLECIMKDR